MWQWKQEARFRQLANAALTGYVRPEDAQELNALRAARDKVPAREQDTAATLAWLRTLRRKELRKLIFRLAVCNHSVLDALIAMHNIAGRELAREMTSMPGWDVTREARFSSLVYTSTTGWMTPAESQELRALKAARDKARAEGTDIAALSRAAED